MAALTDEDARLKSEQLRENEMGIIEALLTLCHDPNPMSGAFVGKIAELASMFVIGRGGTTNVVPRTVGEFLREQLALSTRRRNAGCQIDLDRKARERVHRLARTYNLLEPVSECAYCKDVLEDAANGAQT
jgi:hypothetical protein